MRPNHLVILSLTAAACNSAVPDELAGETANDEAGKEDGDGAFTYWKVERVGDGFKVSRPNRTSTQCGSGVHGASCDVESLDLAHTAMPASVAKDYVERLRNGEAILLRGELGTETPALAFERLSRTLGAAIAAADLVPTLPASAPSIHVGDESGPDCLYARLFVQDVAVANAQISLTPTIANTLAFEAKFDGVAIAANSEFALACVNGTSTGTVRTSLTATGTLTIAADGTLAVANASYTRGGITWDSPTPPPQTIQSLLLDNDLALGNIVMGPVAHALEPMIAANHLGRALATTEVWVPGSDSTDLSGVFVLAEQEGDGVLERRLNSTRFAEIDEVDLTASGAADDVVSRATEDLGADGVLLVGYRYIDGGKHGRAANQFWTKAPVPLH